MKCHAGVEFPSGKPCPKCNAKLGEVCWPGINADLLALARLKQVLANRTDPDWKVLAAARAALPPADRVTPSPPTSDQSFTK
jgi:hypothetical protein